MKKIFIASLLCASLFNTVMSQSNRASVGNLTYDLPSGWTAEPRGNSVVLRPNDALRSRSCMVVITTGLEIRGNFQTWAENQWTSVKGTRREVTRQDIPSQTDATGMEALAITATLQIGSTPKQYHLFSAFRQGTSGATFSFVTDGEDYFLKYEAAVKAIAGSLKYPMTAGKAAAGTPSNAAPIQTPPVSTPPSPIGDSPVAGQSFERFQKKQSRSGPRDLPSKLPEPMVMPPGSAELAARILAQTIIEGGDQALPALMRAVLAAGHPIIRSDGAVLFSPPQGTSNGIGILDAEVVFAADSLDAGISVSWVGMGRVIQRDPFFKGIDILPYWKSELLGMSKSAKSSNRFCAAFIRAIAAASGGLYTDPAEATSSSQIAPIQAHLFLLRSFGALYLAGRSNVSSIVDSMTLPISIIYSGPFAGSIDLALQSDSDSRFTMDDVRNNLGNDPGANIIFEAIERLVRGRPTRDLSVSRLISITQTIWILNYITIRMENIGIPIIRKKTYLSRGETREYPVRLFLFIPPGSRAHFERYARDLGVAVQLPPDGEMSFNSDLGFRPVVTPLGSRSADLIEIKKLEIPSGTSSGEPARLIVEGAPQQKQLPDDPKEDPKTAEIRITMKSMNSVNPWRISREQPTTWEIVAAEFDSMFKFDFPLRVTDWKGTNWKGSIYVQADGAGSWNSPDMTTQLEWRIDRAFYSEFEFDGSVAEGLIPGTVRTNPTARGPRKYTTSFPKRNPPAYLKYQDYIKLRGPRLNCILEKEEEVTIRMEANLRDPKGFNEEILTGTHRDVRFQRESVEGSTAVQFWQTPPPVPITERTETTVVSTRKDAPPNEPPVTKDRVVNLLNRIRINRAAGPFIINNAVVKETPTGLVVEDEINDNFELDLGIKTGSSPQKLHVKIRWKLELVGGTNTGALPSVIDQALTFAGFMRELNKLLSTIPVDESPATVKVSFLDGTVGVASCSLANHRIAGKLKHQSKTAAETGTSVDKK